MGYAAAIVILLVLLSCVAVLFVWCVVQWVSRKHREGGCVCSWHVFKSSLPEWQEVSEPFVPYFRQAPVRAMRHPGDRDMVQLISLQENPKNLFMPGDDASVPYTLAELQGHLKEAAVLVEGGGRIDGGLGCGEGQAAQKHEKVCLETKVGGVVG